MALISNKPNLDNIEVGMIFKNLRHMLREIGFTGMNGNSKVADLKVLADYISWEKIPGTNKIRITEIKKR